MLKTKENFQQCAGIAPLDTMPLFPPQSHTLGSMNHKSLICRAGPAGFDVLSQSEWSTVQAHCLTAGF